ncbi:TIGR03087 family PEP-CTERM/XrtA system glycosyltransferase [Alteromonas sp. 1_MG-2023]|uniref:TIGR03087 family PEP-CTERM/XrtA system glycosyltransferase n=1 Tax=Alteromonas sp. 1_MG-2023 TaxID=3062669 RepID=UPI0026E32DE6|nr:TIGR03087 family PEP-CTERM/XrtA system glycosyltransferase [Alteromonas sp. 1_MG-2023]MDO6566314.1 TIGR03087 family PEP-CTERM/XrtA system glycosyltransferase [Alteromonas sp. 1_MG-2023]
MLKICVVAQRVPFPPNKGEKLRTYHQIERLTQLGYQVEVLTLLESEKDKENVSALESHLNIRVTACKLASKARRYSWALLKGQPISVGAFYSEALQGALNQRLASNCDVVLLTASSLGYYIFESSEYGTTNCHILMDFMDVDSDKWKQYATSTKWPMRYIYQRESNKIRKLEKQACAEFLQTYLIADEEVSLFRRQVTDAKPVKVLGNGLDFDAFYPALSPPNNAAPHFLFTGVMDYKPNVDAVVWFVKSCWPKIISRFPDAIFTIAGMNPIAEVNTLASVDGVKVTGFVDDILPCFHEADTFVAPFRLARGVQNKVLQAAACKLPIVTTSMGAEGIAFASPSSMWIEDNENAFAQACINTIENRIESTSRATSAYEAIRAEYSWEQQLKPLEVTLSSL